MAMAKKEGRQIFQDKQDRERQDIQDNSSINNRLYYHRDYRGIERNAPLGLDFWVHFFPIVLASGPTLWAIQHKAPLELKAKTSSKLNKCSFLSSGGAVRYIAHQCRARGQNYGETIPPKILVPKGRFQNKIPLLIFLRFALRLALRWLVGSRKSVAMRLS